MQCEAGQLSIFKFLGDTEENFAFYFTLPNLMSGAALTNLRTRAIARVMFLSRLYKMDVFLYHIKKLASAVATAAVGYVCT